MIITSLLLSFCKEWLYKGLKKSKDLMLVIRFRFGDLRCPNYSFEFFRIRISLTPLPKYVVSQYF